MLRTFYGKLERMPLLAVYLSNHSLKMGYISIRFNLILTTEKH